MAGVLFWMKTPNVQLRKFSRAGIRLRSFLIEHSELGVGRSTFLWLFDEPDRGSVTSRKNGTAKLFSNLQLNRGCASLVVAPSHEYPNSLWRRAFPHRSDRPSHSSRRRNLSCP